MDLQSCIEMGYIASAVLFIFGLKMLGSARTAKRGYLVSAVGMLFAVIATLLINVPLSCCVREHYSQRNNT